MHNVPTNMVLLVQSFHSIVLKIGGVLLPVDRRENTLSIPLSSVCEIGPRFLQHIEPPEEQESKAEEGAHGDLEVF